MEKILCRTHVGEYIIYKKDNIHVPAWFTSWHVGISLWDFTCLLDILETCLENMKKHEHDLKLLEMFGMLLDAWGIVWDVFFGKCWFFNPFVGLYSLTSFPFWGGPAGPWCFTLWLPILVRRGSGSPWPPPISSPKIVCKHSFSKSLIKICILCIPP